MIIIVVLCITALEVFALFKGIDGALLWGVIGVLSTIAGWWGKKRQVEKKQGSGERSLPERIKMSKELNELICSILHKAEEIASKTRSQVDDIVVKFLKSLCNCQ